MCTGWRTDGDDTRSVLVTVVHLETRRTIDLGTKFLCTIKDILTSEGEFWVEREFAEENERKFRQFIDILSLFAVSYESLKQGLHRSASRFALRIVVAPSLGRLEKRIDQSTSQCESEISRLRVIAVRQCRSIEMVARAILSVSFQSRVSST